jgi:hypothetical protein
MVDPDPIFSYQFSYKKRKMDGICAFGEQLNEEMGFIK